MPNDCPLTSDSLLFGGKSENKAAMATELVRPEPDGRAKELFVEGWEFMQILGEGAYAEYVDVFVVKDIIYSSRPGLGHREGSGGHAHNHTHGCAI